MTARVLSPASGLCTWGLGSLRLPPVRRPYRNKLDFPTHPMHALCGPDLEQVELLRMASSAGGMSLLKVGAIDAGPCHEIPSIARVLDS